MKKFLIIDGSSVFYRAFYAMPALTAPGGEPTGALTGFAKIFRFNSLPAPEPTPTQPANPAKKSKDKAKAPDVKPEEKSQPTEDNQPKDEAASV